LAHQLRILVLGSAAGGGFPQWNCLCRVCQLAWRGDPRVKSRSQSSLAVSADGERWLLLNASPDLRQQIIATPDLHPRGARRQSPISAVFITNADVDHLAGLLTLRESQSFTLFGSAATLAQSEKGIFAVLNPRFVVRRIVSLDESTDTGLGLLVTPFAVPGKVALYLEGKDVAVGAETETTIGLRVSDGEKSFFYVPGCAAINDSVVSRLTRAALVFFDGTTFTDSEMVDLGLSHKTAWRMGHVAMSGDKGSLKVLHACEIGRKIYVHINNTNPVLVEDSPERAEVARLGWEIAFDGMEVIL